ncbi:BAHD acyltransferase DCR-like [Canna indica]|uniref:BAHD acyltransferase DCR-like n=1 Tax=Canna indica TaxID=4628 RepID=A0AAQ3QBV7_9LILI|nr:BAHD acyltransferase DCR-like [Canna indica]
MSPNLSSSSKSSSLVASLFSITPNSNSCAADTAASGVVNIVSKFTVCPDRKSDLGDLQLSVSDLPMLSCHYIQKGLFFPAPPMPVAALVSLLASSLSRNLSLFPALAGRLCTLSDGRILISCNDSGAEFSYAAAASFSLPDLLPPSSDVPAAVKLLFPFDGVISFHGHSRPLAAFQLTELADGAVFLGAAVNHAVVDGTSFWNFFNSWAELCRGGAPAPPDFRRNYFGDSKAVLRFPDGRGPEVTFSLDAPLRERIFHFGREAILELKSRTNHRTEAVGGVRTAEVCGKKIHDAKAAAAANDADEISSFQSLCALVWRSVTRARAWLPANATTTFRMAVNCRRRMTPKVSANYFGNAIQSIPTTTSVGDVAARDLRWAAQLLHRNVAAHGDEAVRRAVAEWEAAPRCFPLGNPDGAGITMGSSHRFPMYEGNDFGWGLPAAVRSGRANKFDGKMSAFPGRDLGGSVELEMCLAPETMAALLRDEEFMSYVSQQREQRQ